MEKSNMHIILSAAISIDGKISTRSNDSKLSSQDDSIRLHKLRSKVDAILIGKNTLLQDNPLLTVRHTKGKNPTRIILDSKGTISKNSKIIKTSDKIPTIIAVSKKISNVNLSKLKKLPVEIIISGENSVNLKLLMKKLSTKKIETILVEGGGTVNWEFIKNNIFDGQIYNVLTQNSTVREVVGVISEFIPDLKIEFVDAGADFITARMPVTKSVHQPDGVLHGGATAALAETVGSFAAHIFLDTDTYFVRGIDISAQHVKSIKSGFVYAKANGCL